VLSTCRDIGPGIRRLQPARPRLPHRLPSRDLGPVLAEGMTGGARHPRFSGGKISRRNVDLLGPLEKIAAAAEGGAGAGWRSPGLLAQGAKTSCPIPGTKRRKYLDMKRRRRST